jgi:hypothetical protein
LPVRQPELPFSPPVARRAARSSGDRPSLGDGPAKLTPADRKFHLQYSHFFKKKLLTL